MFKNLGIVALFIASVRGACWASSQGFSCCTSTTEVVYTDESGDWGVENDEWCGIPKKEEVEETCFAKKLGYSCCPEGTEVNYTDEDGDWGYVNDDWCGIVKVEEEKCWSEELGFPCCQTTNKVEYTDDDGKWGYENDDWCGITDNIKITTTTTTRRTTTTTTRRTTTTTTRRTTTTRKPAATYSVIYETGKKLNSGYENWGWDAKIAFKDSALVVTSDRNSYGAASIKKLSGYYGTGGCIHVLAKSETKAFIKVQGLEGEDEEDSFDVGTIQGEERDFTRYMFDVDSTYKFDRIIIQDGAASGNPINVRYLIYSTGSCDDFNPPVDTSKVPVTTTTRKSNTSARYTIIFKTTSGMPSGYDNWGWGCSISYSGGAMVINPDKGEYGAVSLKKLSGSFTGGSLRFDMKNEGKVNVIVENSDKDEKFNVDTIDPSDDYQTYILNVDFDLPFDRINFQDAKGSGDRIWIKNLVHSTGSAEDFVDPIY